MLYLECANSYIPDAFCDPCLFCGDEGCEHCNPDLEVHHCIYCGGEYSEDFSCCTCESGLITEDTDGTEGNPYE